jgi:hypothetical protein
MAKEIKDVLTENYPEMEWVLMDTPTNKVEFEEYFIVHTLGSHKKPTWEELETQLVDMQAEYDSKEYARKRKAEYDQLNQFEMMFDDKRDGTTTWVDKINEIKQRHPKK